MIYTNFVSSFMGTFYNDMLKIIKGTFILLCILSFSISLNTTTTFASINNFYVDESIYGQTFSDWNLSTAYKQGDLVLFCDKVYCATEKMTGIIPGTDSRWVCKADLGYLNTLDVSNKCELTANTTDSNTKITVQIPVLRYEGVATRSNYTFTVYLKIPSFTPWDAAVLSYIHYDDGERTINKIDTFGHTILKPDVLRKVSYSFHHIKKVQAVITGRYNGQELTPTGCFMEPPIM